MGPFAFNPDRRFILRSGIALSTSLFLTPGLFAEELSKTESQTEGPFYPDKFPLDTDNDLLIINDTITPAVGEITHLTGRVLDMKGNPISGAVVEIWQCDNNGAYLHSGTDNKAKRDKNFQGFGRFTTGSKGEYYFRTIKPVPYPGRSPHIHVKIKKGGKELLVSQLYVKDHPGNAKDGIFSRLKNQKSVEAAFTAIKGSKTGELAANWDIVLGVVPEMK